jgi:hypothetical protein
MEIRKPFQMELSNWFAVLEYLNDSEDINRAWKNKENMKISAKETLVLYEGKQLKP